MRWEEIRDEMRLLDQRQVALHLEWKKLKEACAHRNMPVRKSLEQHMDTCPDCGHIQYLVAL